MRTHVEQRFKYILLNVLDDPDLELDDALPLMSVASEKMFSLDAAVCREFCLPKGELALLENLYSITIGGVIDFIYARMEDRENDNAA
jgi:hypothetical protein